MNLRKYSVAGVLFVSLAAAMGCAKKPALDVQSSANADTSSGTAACDESAAGTPAHCECIGGYVKGDIGDGKVACAEGETELGRVQQGIEGAVCCKAPLTQTTSGAAAD